MRDTERKAETQQREKQAPCREPDAGLDLGSLSIMPWAEGGAKPLSHPGCPELSLFFFLIFIYLFIHERHTQRERQRHSRGRSRLHAGSPMRDSIPA